MVIHKASLRNSKIKYYLDIIIASKAIVVYVFLFCVMMLFYLLLKHTFVMPEDYD